MTIASRRCFDGLCVGCVDGRSHVALRVPDQYAVVVAEAGKLVNIKLCHGYARFRSSCYNAP